jgi:hypothetical protein
MVHIYIYSKKQQFHLSKKIVVFINPDRSLNLVVVTTTGQFVAIHGPYIARNNDASILNRMLKCNINDIKGFVKDNDIFVVDRGFRDSLTLLDDLGIKAAMPSFMKKGEK